MSSYIIICQALFSVSTHTEFNSHNLPVRLLNWHPYFHFTDVETLIMYYILKSEMKKMTQKVKKGEWGWEETARIWRMLGPFFRTSD